VFHWLLNFGVQRKNKQVCFVDACLFPFALKFLHTWEASNSIHFQFRRKPENVMSKAKHVQVTILPPHSQLKNKVILFHSFLFGCKNHKNLFLGSPLTIPKVLLEWGNVTNSLQGSKGTERKNNLKKQKIYQQSQMDYPKVGLNSDQIRTEVTLSNAKGRRKSMRNS
jgi:hypothetical protein